MKYLPHTPEDLQEMLRRVGVQSLDELYADVPQDLIFKGELDMPSEMSETEIRQLMGELADKNDRLICFGGGGVYDHYTPSVVPYIASRSEFSTSYTPYQAEISQGTLQYIFEYQTMMADLTGMEISNASMYDGATATAEAMFMCVAAAKKRNKVLISESFNPIVMRVVETYAKYHGVDLVKVPVCEGVSDKAEIERLLAAEDVAGVMVPQPNYFGLIEDFTGLADACHAHKALLVINTVASALGVLRTPGEWGADIACGDAQSLGIPMSFGGPYIGYLCTNSSLVRKMPGRLVGATTDTEGRRCFVLTLQAREQHIRREKATSNICTAQGVMCLYVAAYLSLMGPKGLREVNELSYAGAHYLYERLVEMDSFEPCFDGPFLNEFALRYRGEMDLVDLRQALAYQGYLPGIMAEGRSDTVIFAVTEQRTKAQMDQFVELLRQFID